MKEAGAVKHPVESIGVPHPEIGAILINGAQSGLDTIVRAGDRVDVWPELSGDGHHGIPLRPGLKRPPQFVLDTHLGQLTTWLRLLGFDSLYANDADDPLLAQLSAEQGRILLTRDRGLLMRKVVVHGYCPRSTLPDEQLIDVVRRFSLAPEIAPWTRCLRCNGTLRAVSKDEVLDQLEPRTRLYFEVFQRCSDCGRVYWRGSHRERMESFVVSVVERAAASP
jgi:hypothetical protein